MKAKLFDYVERDNFVYRLSGITKLLAFIFLTFAVMFTYDLRSILCILVFSFFVLWLSEIRFSQIRLMCWYVLVFLIMNAILTYIFNPEYGVEIYGTKHELLRLNGRYTLTLEQLFYQGTKFVKYVSVIPLGMIFLFTTDPSEFAASLNSIGVSYKAAYAVALTLRYFPDMVRDYEDIALAQQSRGQDLSKKEKLTVRAKNMINICVPLIFSTMDRIELITNAMDLRSFGKHKKRTWYAKKPLKGCDYAVIGGSIAVFAAVMLVAVFINHGRYWNPFI